MTDLDFCQQLLGNAVVKQAALDYCQALVEQNKANENVKELEEFFSNSEVFNAWTNLDGVELMKRLRKKMIDNKYKMPEHQDFIRP